MLVKIPLLSFLIFGVTYPLFFWVSYRDPIKHNFHRFHLACPVIMAGLSILSLWLIPVNPHLRIQGLVWLLAALALTCFFWNKDNVHVPIITILCLWGIRLFANVYADLVIDDKVQVMLYVLSGLIVSGIFYAMNLGHFYLNVLGLKIDHLRSAVIVFGVLTCLRFAWDLYAVFYFKVMYLGETIPLTRFLGTMEGFMLWVAFFFGVLFPLGSLYFALGTLKLKNTQATTGILYVILSGVLLGDLAFKYFLIKYQIPM